MELVPLQQTHLEGVLTLLEKGKPYVFPHHHYIYWMLQKYCENCNYVCTDGEVVAGFLGAIPSEETGTLFLWQIVIDPAFQGQGLGTRLLEKAEAYAKDRGYRRIEFTIDAENGASFAMFSRFARRLGSEMVSIDTYGYNNSKDILYRVTL